MKPAFSDGEFYFRVRKPLYFCRHRLLLIPNINALGKPPDCFFGQRLPCPDQISFIYMLSWGKQPVCKRTVIGKQKQSLRIFIQTSHRKQAAGIYALQKPHHSRRMLILRGSYHTGRLV